MQEQGHGTLVVFSSIAGVRARRANFVYGSTKAALDALGVGVDLMLDGSGAQVIVVRPGFVVGRMTAGMARAPFACSPEDVARATVAALRGRRRVVWVPGRLVVLAWAMRLLPHPVWKRLRRSSPRGRLAGPGESCLTSTVVGAPTGRLARPFG